MGFIPSAGLLASTANTSRRNRQKQGEKIPVRSEEPMGKTEAEITTMIVQREIIEMQEKEIGIYKEFLEELGAEISERWEKSERPIISPIDGLPGEYTPKIVKIYLNCEWALDSPSLFDKLSKLEKRLDEIKRQEKERNTRK